MPKAKDTGQVELGGQPEEPNSPVPNGDLSKSISFSRERVAESLSAINTALKRYEAEDVKEFLTGELQAQVRSTLNFCRNHLTMIQREIDALGG